MAGDWIKIEHVTPDKPEVFVMSEMLGIDPDAIVGKLIRFWSWCDQQSIDGNAITVTQSFLDRITHQPGFSDALRKVGWLEVRSGSLQVPRFDRHNGHSAKARAESNRRVAKHRQGNGGCVTNVTGKALQKPLPEKRREEKKEDTPLPPKSNRSGDLSDFDGPTETPPLCTLSQARSMGSSIGLNAAESEHWWHTRNASGWTKGSPSGGAARKITSPQSDMASSVAWIRESLAKSKLAPTNGNTPKKFIPDP